MRSDNAIYLDRMVSRIQVAETYDLCLIRSGDATVWLLGEYEDPYRWIILVPDILRCGWSMRYIYGESKNGYFILDIRRKEERSILQPLLIKDRDNWLEELRRCGIGQPPELCSPKTLAQSKSAMELRPWDFRIFGGIIGVTDDVMSGIIMGVAVVVSMIFGLWPIRIRTALLAAAGVGAVAGLVADTVVIMGPGTGIIGVPILTLMAFSVGRLARLLFMKLTKKAVHPR